MTPPAYLERKSDIEVFSERYLTHTKAEFAGQPLIFEPWQQKILRTIFNQVDENGNRIVRKFYFSVPRKQGKTTFAAAVALYMLYVDREPGAEIYSAATSSEQARYCFELAQQMILNSPYLSKRTTVNKDAIRYKDRTFKPLPAEAKRSHSISPSCVIVDELHLFESKRDREFYEGLTSGQGARRQPLTLFLTTAGYNSLSLCGEIDRYAQQVEEGVMTDRTLSSFISRADEEDDWQDPATWKKAQPNLGISVSEQHIAAEANAAKQSPAEVLKFKRFQLNQWVENVSEYITLADWDVCDYEVDAEKLKGRECDVGIDLSSRIDLSALVLVFPPQEENEPYQVLPFGFLPKENMTERVRKDMVSYDIWSKDGFPTLTPGNVIDHDFLINKVVELSKDYRIRDINIDPWNSTAVTTALQAEGFQVVDFRRGFKSMSSPTKDLLSLVKQKRIAHGGHPVLRWCINNLRVETDAAENVKPTKEKSRDRIDLAVALIMALDSAVATNTKPKQWSLDDFYTQMDELKAQEEKEKEQAKAIGV